MAFRAFTGSTAALLRVDNMCYHWNVPTCYILSCTYMYVHACTYTQKVRCISFFFFVKLRTLLLVLFAVCCCTRNILRISGSRYSTQRKKPNMKKSGRKERVQNFNSRGAAEIFQRNKQETRGRKERVRRSDCRGGGGDL